jgi:hypothetical protein
MDVNDIRNRINRVETSLNSRVDHDFARHAKIEFIDKGVSVTMPARDSKETIENSVLSILHHLATLKDHLKNCLERKGYDPKIIEEAVKKSVYLQVLLDLVNYDKHGSPTRVNHSGRNPVIRDEHQGLVNNNHGKPVIMTISPTGDTKVVDGIPPSVITNANIFTGDGKFLFDFDELVEVCYSQWIEIARQYECL